MPTDGWTQLRPNPSCHFPTFDDGRNWLHGDSPGALIGPMMLTFRLCFTGIRIHARLLRATFPSKVRKSDDVCVSPFFFGIHSQGRLLVFHFPHILWNSHMLDDAYVFCELQLTGRIDFG